MAQQKLVKDKADLEGYLHQNREAYEEIIGRSAAAEALRDRIAIVAASPVDVLILGESGTGKELVAKAIHRTGRRCSGQFVAVDCGALSDNLAEAELFGYRKGSFTGAAENRQGLLEAANGGMLFLDEISNLPWSSQTKMLRVLEEREVRRIGDTVARKIDVQIIAATNRDLLTEIEEGRFREDLYYRLKKMDVRVPPLRERREDVPLLIHFFMKQIAEDETALPKSVSSRAMAMLESYSYPGNIRELRNVVSWAYYSSPGPVIDVEDLPPEIRRDIPEAFKPDSDLDLRLYRDILKGKGTFQASIKEPFLNHKFGVSVVRGVVRRALQDTKGRYRDALERLRVPHRSYAVTMQFLKRHDCYLDFRPFRHRNEE
ncbi:MAG: sigma-54 dependent transcriptional regulator [Acidobacteriota bacterium]